MLKELGAEIDVNQPLMPKGVEHLSKGEAISTGSLVNQPLMPKGVEHVARFVFGEDSYPCEPTSDAERR